TELDAWAASAAGDGSLKRTVPVTVFDGADGVRSTSQPRGNYPQVAKSVDGRLWLISPDAVGVVDPRHLPFNSLPPPVHIEQITADRQTYEATPAVNGRVQLP